MHPAEPGLRVIEFFVEELLGRWEFFDGRVVRVLG
jgi:hypothetical protein